MKRLIVCLALIGLAACTSSSTGTPAGPTSLSLSDTPSPATVSESVSGSESEQPESESPSAGDTAPEGNAVVTTGRVDGLGTVLVNADGQTLYLYKSKSGTDDGCQSCEDSWSPVITSETPVARGGADASMIGTTSAPANTQQVTYAGHPLYTFVGDSGAGQANGQAADGKWFAVTAKGKPAAPMQT
jgi:predicted lipoprotein with Yx(FWY)xxD motif